LEFPFFIYNFALVNGSLIININTIMAKLIEIFSYAGQGKSLVIVNKLLQSVNQEQKCLLIIDESEVTLYRERMKKLCKDNDKLRQNCEVYVLCYTPLNNNEEILSKIKEIIKYKSKGIKFSSVFVDCIYAKPKREGKPNFLLQMELYKEVDNVIITEQLTYDATNHFVYGNCQYVCQKEGDVIIVEKLRDNTNNDIFTEEKEIIPII